MDHEAHAYFPMNRSPASTLWELIASRAEDLPDRVAVVFENAGVRADEVRDYATLWQNACRIAAGLRAAGMTRGDRFGLVMRNHPEFIETMIAASISGCVFVPIDPRSMGAKLAFTLRHSRCRGILCADYVLANIAAIQRQLPNLEWVRVLETNEEIAPPTPSIKHAQPLAEWLQAPALPIDPQLQSTSDPLQIIYTSGTTGDPKGVVFPNQRFGTAANYHSLFTLRPTDRLYTGLSLTHGNAQLLTLAPALGLAVPAVFSRKFTKTRLWDICRTYECTVFNLLGGMATAIYSEPVRRNDADNPVRMVISAGMPRAIWEAFERRFCVSILEMYGAIEGGFAYKPIGVGPVGSFGKAPASLELRIVDEQGNECPPHVPGELISRPRALAAQVEYLDDPQASIRKTAGGWLRSGDVCHRDEQGWLFFDYRKGGGLRHNGDFVNPGFIEKVLAEHPAITDVFVYGVPAKSGAPGERDVVAAIVPQDRATFAARSVFAHCRRELESNFVPSYLQVVEQIPKTASEKPQERFLREIFTPTGPGIYTE